MYLADTFVIMDNMNFTSYSYINRNRIIQGNRAIKLTLPVKNKKTSQLIKDVKLDYGHKYRGNNKHLKSITHSYKSCTNYETFFPLLETILVKNHKWLIDLNLEIIFLIKNYLKLDTEIILGSEKKISGKKEDELFLSLLEKTKSKEILLGLGASTKYIDTNIILKYGGKISYQELNHPVYRQKTTSFIKGISIIDLLMNYQREKAIDIISNCGQIKYKTI